MLTQTFFACLFLASSLANVSYPYHFEEECVNYVVYPVHYNLYIYPYLLDNDRSYYDCDLTIGIMTKRRYVNKIELDAKNMVIKRDSVKVLVNNRDIINHVRPYEYDHLNGKLCLFLTEDLQQFEERNKITYEIKISFTKYLKGEDSGIFVVKYRDQGKEKIMMTTRLSPNKAKYFYPCFENPQIETVFTAKVILGPDQRERHNTTLFISDEYRRIPDRNNKFLTIEYGPSHQVAPHQTGFHYSDFRHIQVKSNGINNTDTLILWAPESNLKHYTYISNYGRAIMNLIHEYSEWNHSIVEGPINLVAVPVMMDSYEVDSWNLLNIGDYKLLYSTQHTSINQKEEMSYLLSQQLSRIWLDNPGEPNRISKKRTKWVQQWLKEGMAAYLGHYFLSRTTPPFWDFNTYGLYIRNKAMTLDWRHDTPSLGSFNRTLAVSITSRYRKLVELKTASLLWMVENLVGSEKFHRVLVKYINSRRKYEEILVQDFLMFLKDETLECEFFNGTTVADVLQSWFNQPGYPVVKVTVYRKNGTEDSVYLEQKQFTFTNASHSHQYHKYIIPISYIKENTQDCYNCYQQKFTISDSGYSFKENLHDGWIILNRNASGYYRVNYDLGTWNMIVKTLKGDKRNTIDPFNRAQIVNDAFALYMSDDLDASILAEIVRSLKDETDYVVWDAAVSGFELLTTEGASREMTKLWYDDWKEEMRNAISLIYRKVMNDNERTHQSRLYRARMVNFACFIEHSPCLKDLETTLSLIRRGHAYDPDLREACFYEMVKKSSNFIEIDENNRFAKEDLKRAEKRNKEELRFVYKLPAGDASLIPTTCMPVMPVTAETGEPDSSNSLKISLFTTSIALMIMVFENFM